MIVQTRIGAILFAAIIVGVIIFSWWLARIGLGQVAVGLLGGCLSVVTYHYLRIVA